MRSLVGGLAGTLTMNVSLQHGLHSKRFRLNTPNTLNQFSQDTIQSWFYRRVFVKQICKGFSSPNYFSSWHINTIHIALLIHKPRNNCVPLPSPTSWLVWGHITEGGLQSVLVAKLWKSKQDLPPLWFQWYRRSEESALMNCSVEMCFELFTAILYQLSLGQHCKQYRGHEFWFWVWPKMQSCEVLWNY